MFHILKLNNFKNKLKKIFPIILLLLLITIIIGVTYATYLVTLQSEENSITTGLVSMSYTESTNVIAIENALPMSDMDGKTQNNYFDFSVTSNLTLNETNPDTNVNYSIEIEPLSANTLFDNQIKLYLENITTNEVLIDSKLINELENYTLYTTKHIHKYNINTVITKYRLRVWIDYNTDVSNWSNNGYEYKFRVNVNGNIKEATVVKNTSESCFELSDQDDDLMTATISSYTCNETSPKITDVKIPDVIDGYSITAIGEGAFSDMELTSVIIPDSITLIGEEAFYNNNLTSVKISNNLKSIESYTFYNNNLTSVIIPDTVETIGSSAFSYNDLTNITIPESVISIKSEAFSYNDLTSVVIPSTVSEVIFAAFSNNPNLSSIIVDKNNTVYDSRNNSNAIIKTSNNALIVGCKSTIIPDTVTSIGDYAFYGTDLSAITIPSSVTSIGSSVFYDNPNLSSIIVDSNNTVYDSRNNSNAVIKTSTNKLFIGCKSTIIPSTVTSIENFAFYNVNLSSITIPNGVTYIGYQSFMNNNLTSIVIPESVTKIGPAAFAKNKLTSVKIMGKSSSSDFVSYASNIWGWATGYSDSDIEWFFSKENTND